MSSIAMTAEVDPMRPHNTATPMPVSVQILSTLLFAGFAIPVTIIALDAFWPAGVALAIILGWRGGFAPGYWGRSAPAPRPMADLAPEAVKRTSGNASFDAYRHDMLERLEQEQHKFDGFLARLRDAKDKTEFDQFMDDRAAKAQLTSAKDTGRG